MAPAQSKTVVVHKLDPFGSAVAGSLGAVFANAAVYPLDLVKTRLQVQHRVEAGKLPKTAKGDVPYYANARDAFRKILKNDGVLGFYAGLIASLIGTASTSFAYFFAYTLVRTTYLERLAKSELAKTAGATPGKAGQIGIAVELALGALAGALAQIFTIPVSVIATRQQTATTEKERAKSLLTIARDIIHEDTVTGLWKGLKPSLVLCVNPAITYGLFERLRPLLFGDADGTAGLLGAGGLNPIRAFSIGAISKTCATIVTYPYIMAKVRLQAKQEEEEEQEDHQDGPSLNAEEKGTRLRPTRQGQRRKRVQYNGALDVLRQVYKTDGLSGWYTGMQAQITKAVVSQALLFMMKDIFERNTIQLLLYISRLLQGRRIGGIAAPLPT